ncbi:MAG TPA: UDP-N-acetylmuramoyl-L-alanyl-D-glutamate--2,6-diaminopimelate ligase [Acidimicrobiales bacterium]|nr:UDP-N-acetylmuramoyl-L-alanyl-D-glutamate--2,6-diaminopimelate ligase [Acidimicrobiales bacterium]
MRLDELLGAVRVEQVVGDPSGVEVAEIVHDSRAVTAGALFCCVSGASVDGHRFAPDAVRAGAVALLAERELSEPVPQLIVPDTRTAMGPLAAVFHGEPSRTLDVVGVTGTNGKTTTTHFMRSILERAGRPARVIGTLTGTRTTPEATDLQALLARYRDEGVRAVSMEVSSHALAQHRVDATWFRVGVFTNLSRDHLDFHGGLEEYFAAKARLFEPERCAAAVVNVDDPWGRRLSEMITIPWRACSLDLVDDIELHAGWSRCLWEGVELRVPLGGRFNLMNGLIAALAARTLGVMPDVIAEGLVQAGPVSGRFESVDAGQPFTVIVDYAHTPDGLEQVLRAAREIAGRGRVAVVFGCGGERDPSKRGPMGAVAAEGADTVILTSDNPRGEDPSAIIDAVLAGIPEGSPVRVEPDRRAAIAAALERADAGDVVVIAGKGHETTQVIGGREVPFDDRAVARALLKEHAWSDS